MAVLETKSAILTTFEADLRTKIQFHYTPLGLELRKDPVKTVMTIGQRLQENFVN
jgi:hypothetical protein